ncbi:Copper-containing nitrite reductase precursor [Corynebacterium ciconiae DSM 44920]|uniref:multicopper oxidase domain-containing protein n=1 Tax=Corynebacterium ciconiae TaxID=227319 RepID=UPI00037A2BF6|nr:multicopper oxidase domain-containing protein [Corynebacterium ciconiae]WKD60194.1 Copper-containing nitrite reductase precursor [Corynebacterium ciconiae DSM 44920]
MNAGVLPLPTPSTRADTRSRRGRQQALPATLWLIALVIISLAHPFIPHNQWILTHTFTLGVLSNSILIWSCQLSDQLLHLRPSPSTFRTRAWIIGGLNLGIVAVLVGQLLTPELEWDAPLLSLGAVVVTCSVLANAVHLILLRRGTDSPRRFGASLWLFALAQALFAYDLLDTAFIHLGTLSAKTASTAALGHVITNVFGFVGLTAAGAAALLFPTIWRAQGNFGADNAIAWILGSGSVLAICALRLHSVLLIGLALAIYGVGWLIRWLSWIPVMRSVFAAPRDRITFSSLALATAPLWLIGSLAAMSASLLGGTIPELPVLPLLVGFAAQLLIGTLSHLLPSMLGGGPAAVRAGLYRLQAAGLLRWTLLNGGLLIWILPGSSSWLKVAASILATGALAAFLPLLLSSRRRQRAVLAGRLEGPAPRTHSPAQQITAGLAILALVASLVGMQSSPRMAPAPTSGPVAESGTTELSVDAHDMRFSPATLEVPKGHRLLLTVRNTDPHQAHDLVLATGQATGRIPAGESVQLDAGVITAPVEGWCSIAGHRLQGMTLQITVAGQRTSADGHASAHGEHTPAAAADTPTQPEKIDPAMVADPELAAAPESSVHRHTFEISETEFSVDGRTRGRWTFNDQLTGPTLRGRVGDIFEITLLNHGSMNHSIDFHAGMVSPDEVMREIAPGEQLQYRFRAEHAGAWLYHCGTAPMSLHLAAGMFGAVIIDPPDLAQVDHEYILVQSEVYGLNTTAAHPVDEAKLQALHPDATVFNGLEFGYVAAPLALRSGETARFWVVNAGPNIATSFHIVGTQFHTMYKEGAYQLRDAAGDGAAQALDLLAAQGGFVEARFPEAGTYTFVNHQFIDAERGAKGHIIVSD